MSAACAAGCPRWTSYVNQNAHYGVRFSQYRTANDCRDFCSKLLQCVAVDFDANADLCWLHFDTTHLVPDNIYQLPNVTQFVVDRSCAVSNTATTVTTTSTTRTAASTTTTTTTTTTSKLAANSTGTIGTTVRRNQNR